MGQDQSTDQQSHTSDEIHVFILWQNGKKYKLQLYKELEQNFEILSHFDVQWDKNSFSANLSKFYGQKLTSSGSKIKHIGTGPFDLFLIRDRSPDYQMRKTSRGHAIVNIRIFDFKENFRSVMGGGHLLHASNDSFEAKHDFCLLFGMPIDKYDVAGVSKLKPLTHLPGVAGWRSVAEIFTVLNECDEYVVMRNFDPLPDAVELSHHGDIDLLSRNWRYTRDLLSAEPKFNDSHRRHFKVTMSDHSSIPFDLRDEEDNYYDPKWSSSVLDTRVLSARGVHIPSAEHLEFMTIYHALVHKHFISKDYAVGGPKRSWAQRLERLHDFMQQRHYTFTLPDDRSVGFDNRFRPDKISTVARNLKSLHIDNVKPFQVDQWKNRFQTQYFTGLLKDTRVFIKYGGISGSARREYEILKKFVVNGESIFQNPLHYSDRDGLNILVLPFVDGVSLNNYLENNTFSFELKQKFENFLNNVLSALTAEKVIHRDIRPENILVTKDEEFILIDFQMALSITPPIFKEYPLFKYKRKELKNLGGDFKVARYIWNDGYSVKKLKDALELNQDMCKTHTQYPGLGTLTWYGARNNFFDKLRYKFYNILRKKFK